MLVQATSTQLWPRLCSALGLRWPNFARPHSKSVGKGCSFQLAAQTINTLPGLSLTCFMRQLAARTDEHPGQGDESWLCCARSKKTRLLLGSRRGSYRPAGRGRGAEGEPRRRRAARLAARHTGRPRPLRRAKPRRKSPPLTSYQLRHLPDPARDVGRQHGEVLLVALEVGGHGGGAGGGRGPTALRGDRRAQPGALQPLRTQALPRSATCKGVPLRLRAPRRRFRRNSPPSLRC